jgi:hypothetical protein
MADRFKNAAKTFKVGDFFITGGIAGQYIETELGTQTISVTGWRERDEEEIKATAYYLTNAGNAYPTLIANLERIISRIEECELQDHFPSAFQRAKQLLSDLK